jgi:hypothetical protein
MSFTGNPQQQNSRFDDAFAALAYRGYVTKASPPRAQPRDWLIWADVRVGRIEHWEVLGGRGCMEIKSTRCWA